MADSVHVPDNRKEVKHSIVCHKTQPFKSLVASIPKYCSMKALQSIGKVDKNIFSVDTISEIGIFLLKAAILEAVRRFSKAHCSFLWHSLQALQFICLPPLKWIQKWGFFRGLVKSMQALSRPLLLLSVATSFSNRSDEVEGNPGSSEASDASQTRTDPLPGSLTGRASDSSGVNEIQTPEKWMLQLFAELEKEGIVLPERITEDDLRRFYRASNGDFSSFLSSVRRTIDWRRNFQFMSEQELEDWSEMVFWHGFDVKRHPCLFIRVQSACSNVKSGDRFHLPEVLGMRSKHNDA